MRKQNVEERKLVKKTNGEILHLSFASFLYPSTSSSTLLPNTTTSSGSDDIDVESLPPLSESETRQVHYFLQQRAMSPGLGLSTQLLSYIHFIAAAQAAKTRVIVFPESVRTSWFTLINMTASTFPGRPLVYVATNQTTGHVYGIRGGVSTKSFFKWTRERTRDQPYLVKKKFINMLVKNLVIVILMNFH